jgi:hypothetical protein
VRPQLHELTIHLQFWLYSFLFLLVFFDSQERISLVGEISHATPVDNLRRRGATIAWFVTCCSEAGSNYVATPPNRELTEPFERSGTLVHISWYQIFWFTVRFVLNLVRVFCFHPRVHRKAKKILLVRFSRSQTLFSLCIILFQNP